MSVDEARAQLMKLDLRLGVNVGAEKERERLGRIIDGAGTAARKPTRRGKRGGKR